MMAGGGMGGASPQSANPFAQAGTHQGGSVFGGGPLPGVASSTQNGMGTSPSTPPVASTGASTPNIGGGFLGALGQTPQFAPQQPQQYQALQSVQNQQLPDYNQYLKEAQQAQNMTGAQTPPGMNPYQPGMQLPISSVNTTTQQDIMGGRQNSGVPFMQAMGQLGLGGQGVSAAQMDSQQYPQQVQTMGFPGLKANSGMNPFQTPQPLQTGPHFQQMQRQLQNYGNQMNQMQQRANPSQIAGLRGLSSLIGRRLG